MKLFAALPLVVVLVSICGAPAPASNSTVSGVVFHDANLNGVRDLCDRALGGKGVVLSQGGERQDAVSDEEGRFLFEEIESGLYDIRLSAAKGWQWPMTTVTGASVEVDGVKDVEGVELGSATVTQLDTGEPHLLGLAFEDSDGDGSLDPGECALRGSSVWSENMIYDTGPLGEQSGALRLMHGESIGEAYVDLPKSDAWRQTAPFGTCPWASPQLTYGDNVYQAIFGFTPDHREPGQLRINAFLDSSGDGVRGDDEPDLDASRVAVTAYVYDDCSSDVRPETTVDLLDARVRPISVSPGNHEVRLEVLTGDPLSDGIRVFTTSSTAQIEVGPGEERTLEFGIKEEHPAKIDLHVFEDVDRDGAYDFEEPAPLEGAICFSLLTDRAGEWAYQNCTSINVDGVTTLEVPPGRYEALVAPQYWGCTGCPEAVIRFEVSDGQNPPLNVPVSFADYFESLTPTPKPVAFP